MKFRKFHIIIVLFLLSFAIYIPESKADNSSSEYIPSAISSIEISVSDGIYSANYSNGTTLYGGFENAGGVNGSSFADVVGNSTQFVSDVTILAGNYIRDKSVVCSSNTLIQGQGNSTIIQDSGALQIYAPYNNYATFVIGTSISNVTIANMWLQGNLSSYVHDTFGVFTWYADKVWVHDVTFSNYTLGTSGGVDVCYTTNSTFENTHSFNFYQGATPLWMDIGTVGYVVRNNEMFSAYDMGDGIACVFFDNDGNHTGIITGNIIIGNYTGYTLSLYRGGTVYPYGITVTNNTLIGVNQPGSVGIDLRFVTNCTIERNTIQNFAIGINNVNASDTVIKNNNSTNNLWWGLYSWDQNSNTYSTISLNDFRFNGVASINDDVDKTRDAVFYNLGVDGFPPPSLSSFKVSRTIAGSFSNFEFTATDDDGLSCYIFSTNNTGIWHNDTAIFFVTSPQTVSVTKTLSSTIGEIIGYRWYVNDTFDDFADSGVQTIITVGFTITVNSAFGNAKGSENVALGDSYLTGVMSPISEGADTQYVCIGYGIDDGSTIFGESYTFTNVQANHKITYFWVKQYYLTVSSTYGSPSGGGWYNTGAIAYAGLPSGTVSEGIKTRHEFDYWSTGGGNFAQSNVIIMNSPVASTAFWKTQYLIIPSADSNLAIYPSSSIWVNLSASQVFTFSANPGYILSRVLVDGSLVPITGCFTFNDVTQSHTISVSSEIDPNSWPSLPSSSPSYSPFETPSQPQLSHLDDVILVIAVVVLVLAGTAIIFRRRHWFQTVKVNLGGLIHR